MKSVCLEIGFLMLLEFMGGDAFKRSRKRCEKSDGFYQEQGPVSTNRLKLLYASRHGGPTISEKDKTARRPHSQLYNEYKWI
jgi:hypothetical protein